MRIEAVDLVLPQRLVTNDEIVDLLRFHSRDIFCGSLTDFGRFTERLLRKMGAKHRYWSDKSDKPLHYIAQAATNAISKAGMSKDDIDLVVFTGVDRGFFEPANAYFLAHALGMPSVECFDIVDACNSWSRALQICDSLFRGGSHRTALLLNGEFPLFDGGPINPVLFQVEHAEQLEHRLPAFTLGEAATATVVSANPDENWNYNTLSLPQYADLCTISCHDGGRFSDGSSRLDVNGAGRFTSYAEDMFKYGVDHSMEILRRLRIPLDRIDVIFPHTVSQSAITSVAQKMGIESLIYSVFPRVGNLISASIPATMVLALEEGRLKKTDVAAAWVGSAGMVFSAYTFTNFIESA
jgi:3-oxoacyl-[acyl-carrier-protein] synthase III